MPEAARRTVPPAAHDASRDSLALLSPLPRVPLLHLLRPKWLTARARARGRERGRTARIALLGITGTLFWAFVLLIVFRLLQYFRSVPDIGPLLAGKLLGLIFVSFFAILLLSNIITALSSFFVARDLDLLVSAPVDWLRLYGAEFLILGLAACAAGCIIGFAAQEAIAVAVAEVIRSELPPPRLLPAVQGFLVGLVLLLAVLDDGDAVGVVRRVESMGDRHDRPCPVVARCAIRRRGGAAGRARGRAPRPRSGRETSTARFHRRWRGSGSPAACRSREPGSTRRAGVAAHRVPSARARSGRAAPA